MESKILTMGVLNTLAGTVAGCQPARGQHFTERIRLEEVQASGPRRAVPVPVSEGGILGGIY